MTKYEDMSKEQRETFLRGAVDGDQDDNRGLSIAYIVLCSCMIVAWGFGWYCALRFAEVCQ